MDKEKLDQYADYLEKMHGVSIYGGKIAKDGYVYFYRRGGGDEYIVTQEQVNQYTPSRVPSLDGENEPITLPPAFVFWGVVWVLILLMFIAWVLK